MTEHRLDRIDAAALPEFAFVRLPTVLEFIPLGRSTLFEMIKRGEFPSAVRLSARTSGWRIEDIKAWAAARADVRR